MPVGIGPTPWIQMDGLMHYSPFAAGLSVMAFLKPVQLIEYDAGALEAMTPPLEVLATCEDLPAHGEAARARIE